MAKLTLQEQLLKSGLATSAQAKKVKTDKQKQLRQQQKNNVTVVDEAKLSAQQAKEQAALKDKELNQLRQKEAEQKALLAQIKQLIEPHRVAQDPDGVAYHFNRGGKVKKLYVSEVVRIQLSQGLLGITEYDAGFVIVAAGIIDKIRDRDAGYFVLLNKDINVAPIDDAYAAYVVPDDLVW
jgi:uncharacterized protein YaiL (DUF2058 family)